MALVYSEGIFTLIQTFHTCWIRTNLNEKFKSLDDIYPIEINDGQFNDTIIYYILDINNYLHHLVVNHTYKLYTFTLKVDFKKPKMLSKFYHSLGVYLILYEDFENDNILNNQKCPIQILKFYSECSIYSFKSSHIINTQMLKDFIEFPKPISCQDLPSEITHFDIVVLFGFVSECQCYRDNDILKVQNIIPFDLKLNGVIAYNYYRNTVYYINNDNKIMKWDCFRNHLQVLGYTNKNPFSLHYMLLHRYDVPNKKTLSEKYYTLSSNNNKYIIFANKNKLVIIDPQNDLHRTFDMNILCVNNISGLTLKNFTWSKQKHKFLDNINKNIIMIFLMCNKKMNIYKVPHFVYNIIFNYLIN